MNTNERDALLALADELAAAWNTAKEFDMDEFADRIRALAAPAEGGQGECQHEWRSGDNAIVQRAVFCIHCHEIRTAKAAGSHEPMIDSAGGAKENNNGA